MCFNIIILIIIKEKGKNGEKRKKNEKGKNWGKGQDKKGRQAGGGNKGEKRVKADMSGRKGGRNQSEKVENQR